MSSSFRVKLKVLSPIHIGSGETLTRLDYYFDNTGKFCRVNLDSLFADPDFADQRDKFLEAAPNGERIDKLVPLPLLEKHQRYRLPASKTALQFGKDRSVEVKACIKSAGRVYIPGSSVKGAILSALIWKVLSDGWAKGPDAQQAIRSLVLGNQSDALLKEVLQRIGGRDAEHAGKFTHWLDISDSDFKAPEQVLGLSLVDVKNPNPTRAPAAKDLRLLLETIQKGEFRFTLKLDPASKLKPDSLLSAVNDFYQKVATADKLTSEKPELPSAGAVRLGTGSGAYATSLLLVAKETGLNWGRDGYRVKPPKSRKRAGNADCPMGWAQLELEGT